MVYKGTVEVSEEQKMTKETKTIFRPELSVWQSVVAFCSNSGLRLRRETRLLLLCFFVAKNSASGIYAKSDSRISSD